MGRAEASHVALENQGGCTPRPPPHHPAPPHLPRLPSTLSTLSSLTPSHFFHSSSPLLPFKIFCQFLCSVFSCARERKRMGQAFRRAAGKLRSTGIDTSSSSTPSPHQNSFGRRPPAVTHDRVKVFKNDAEGGSDRNAEVPEGRDPKFEAMLSQMVGRITTKPGGKLEMGEGFVVQKSKRPLPKARTATDSGGYEEKPVAAGTLNVAQLRLIMQLHQGKTAEQDGPMAPKQIADGFRVDPAQLERIFRYVSLPLEDDSSKKRPEM